MSYQVDGKVSLPVLPELQAAVAESGKEDSMKMLRVMVEGKRLRDISDLPFDLAV